MNLDTYPKPDWFDMIYLHWLNFRFNWFSFVCKLREWGNDYIFFVTLLIVVNWCTFSSLLSFLHSNTPASSTHFYVHSSVVSLVCVIAVISFMEFLYQRVSIILTLIEYGINNLLPALVIMENRFSLGRFFFSSFFFRWVDGGVYRRSSINALGIVRIEMILVVWLGV